MNGSTLVTIAMVVMMFGDDGAAWSAAACGRSSGADGSATADHSCAAERPLALTLPRRDPSEGWGQRMCALGISTSPCPFNICFARFHAELGAEPPALLASGMNPVHGALCMHSRPWPTRKGAGRPDRRLTVLSCRRPRIAGRSGADRLAADRRRIARINACDIERAAIAVDRDVGNAVVGQEGIGAAEPEEPVGA
jgi:hypothetical protein